MFGDSVDIAKPNADTTAPNIETGRHPNLFTKAPANGAIHRASQFHAVYSTQQQKNIDNIICI